MNNNVYVRNNKSIYSICITHILFLIPLMIYGIYKNGVYLFIHNYVNLFQMFKPFIFLLTGALIGFLVNVLFEKIIKKNDDSFKDIVFSSFTLEYGILLGCIVSINTNLAIFAGVSFLILFFSKFINNHVNVVAVSFILIYLLSSLFGGFSYLNIYESSTSFSFDVLDYLIGRGFGGIAGTHIILIILGLIGLVITNNHKGSISLYSVCTICVLFFTYSLMSGIDFIELIFNNNYLFALIFVATDSVTSSYTVPGMKIFGFVVGVLTFAFYFVNPILAPFIAISITSLFNILIDNKAKRLIKL